MQSRVDDVDFPVRLVPVVDDGLPVGQVDEDVVVQCIEVEEIVLDVFGLVPCCDDELVHPLRTVNVHNVPEDGLPPDLDHWFGHQMAFLADTRPESTCQNDCLHLPLPKRITAIFSRTNTD